MSDINTNVLRRGDIFWLEETQSNQRVFFTRTAGTYTSDSAMISASIELTPAAAIAVHNTSTTAHNDIRSDVSTVEDRLDALDGVEIEAYSSTATYSRGSANSIVTHSSGLFIYISSTERSSGHDPDTQPGYWLRLSEGVAYEVISSGSHRIAARTIVVNGDNDNVYLCTTTQTTPRNLTYIHAQSQITGGAFILLNGGGGTEVEANPSGSDGEDLSRLAVDGTNYNLAAGISWAFQIDTLLVPELNQDAITDARIILEDSGLTHYLTFLDWAASDLDTISHLPVGAHIGLRQGTTTRILDVQVQSGTPPPTDIR